MLTLGYLKSPNNEGLLKAMTNFSTESPARAMPRFKRSNNQGQLSLVTSFSFILQLNNGEQIISSRALENIPTADAQIQQIHYHQS
jgi:hypothetical protein